MMDSFTQILQRMPATASASLTSGQFGDATPFKVEVNFDIFLFEGNIDADALDNWLKLLEGYFSVHNFLDRENITFALLKEVPHVQNWWGTFINSVKEQYYLVTNYDDQYTKLTILRQERNQTVSEFTNNFHTLCTKLSVKDSE